jgi:hypothetical protein
MSRRPHHWESIVALFYFSCGKLSGSCRARSRAEFVAKLGLVIEEADEPAFWLELLSETGLMPEKKLGDLKSEANQLAAIFNASRSTAKKSCHSTITNQKSTIPDRKAS